MILTDSCCEGDGIEAAEDEHVRAYETPNGVHIHVVGAPGVLVLAVNLFLEGAEVVHATHAFEAGPSVEEVVDLVDGHAITGQVEDNARVDVAGTGAHHDARQWGHSHRGVHGVATTDGGDGSAVPQVKRDLVHLVRGFAQEIRYVLGHVFVARAVEPIPPDGVVHGRFGVDGVQSGCGRE